jgi:hypothetical protein
MMTLASFGAAVSSSTRASFAREAVFALKLYPLVAVVGMAIGFGSAYFGYPIATLPPPPVADAPTVVMPPRATPIDIAPNDTEQAPSDVQAGALVGPPPTFKDRVELRSLLWTHAKGAAEPKLAAEPKIGDTVPQWVQLKPLPSDAEPRLKWMGLVSKDAQPTGIFVYTDDIFVVNPANKVVGIVPLTDQVPASSR